MAVLEMINFMSCEITLFKLLIIPTKENIEFVIIETVARTPFLWDNIHWSSKTVQLLIYPSA